MRSLRGHVAEPLEGQGVDVREDLVPRERLHPGPGRDADLSPGDPVLYSFRLTLNSQSSGLDVPDPP